MLIILCSIVKNALFGTISTILFDQDVECTRRNGCLLEWDIGREVSRIIGIIRGSTRCTRLASDGGSMSSKNVCKF